MMVTPLVGPAMALDPKALHAHQGTIRPLGRMGRLLPRLFLHLLVSRVVVKQLEKWQSMVPRVPCCQQG